VPQDGVPQNPEAWLLTSARHSLIDLVRHRRVAEASEPTLLLLREEPRAMTLSAEFPDERLKLLFVCAHPAIDPAMHTPLMLQTVLGLDVGSGWRPCGPWALCEGPLLSFKGLAAASRMPCSQRA